MAIPFEIATTPYIAQSDELLRKEIAKSIRIPLDQIAALQVEKRSVDARAKKALVRQKGWVYEKGECLPQPTKTLYRQADPNKKVLVIGSGPAGLFAALTLLEKGYSPVVFERGKDVSARKYDLAAINRNQAVNPESNYCFGEGGAGTFSDGKLFTRATKRGDVQNILRKFVEHGANPEILIDAHPHIGSDKLPDIIKAMRTTILDYGGAVLFESKVVDFIVEQGIVKGVVDQHGNEHRGLAVILAVGHSARDIYELFDKNQWSLEAKPFAMGVRVEHPQQLINKIQYHDSFDDPYLSAARYQLTSQVGDRGVFSFCMCPGGVIIPAATGEEQLVVNGMSNSARNSAFANAGIVTTVNVSDYGATSVLAGIDFQRKFEKAMFEAGGRSQIAPAQRMTDFIQRKVSTNLQKSTYHPGLISAPMHELLPSFIATSLQKAFAVFDKKMRGFLTEDALLIGIESRTSSPVRIPRLENGQHVQLKNLYPCGEGSGYAGGIVSSAMDGVFSAEKVIELL